MSSAMSQDIKVRTSSRAFGKKRDLAIGLQFLRL